ncbi:WD repeat-containing protein 37-like [Anneissia japonica]|uniref:WD repeat-containing protein 37-like n=1 Tax=Anneissia japonica TaxID=1529436 RepID=UPI0014258CD8|nr:WD repeat-containing protein 37-like [Anneissia japonica]
MPIEGNMKKANKQRLSIRRSHSSRDGGLRHRVYESDSILPHDIRCRLQKLFQQIEQEFESVYAENLTLQEKVETLTEKLEAAQIGRAEGVTTDVDGTSKVKSKTSNQISQLIRPKTKVASGKNVFSFKGPSSTSLGQFVKSYKGHQDGVWEVSVSKGENPVLGTASADRSARLWSIETGTCVLQYVGHSGSVNSVRFHAKEPLVLTASGDNTAHVWKSTVSLPVASQISEGNRSNPSSGDDLDGSDKEDQDGDSENIIYVKTAQCVLEGHTGVVIAADWLAGGKQIVTASWDRTASIFDVEKASIIHSLTGHDQDLTHCSTHPCQKLVVTSSTDTTFRLWDFRDPSIHSVNVFQGHTDAVTSASFVPNDKVVSGSDDRSVKVWDLKNMRTPIAMIRTDSAVNKLSISPTSHVIAIPHDNRHIRLYDINGVRIGRLPRSNRKVKYN